MGPKGESDMAVNHARKAQLNVRATAEEKERILVLAKKAHRPVAAAILETFERVGEAELILMRFYFAGADIREEVAAYLERHPDHSQAIHTVEKYSGRGRL